MEASNLFGFLRKVCASFERFIPVVACITTVLAAAATAVLMVRLIASDVTSIGTLTEPPVVLGIERFMSGQALYTPMGALPYIIVWYSPLYYVICALAGHLLGVASDNPVAVTAVGRAATAVSSLLLTGLVYACLRRQLKCSRLPAITLCAFVFAYLLPWSCAVRPDGMVYLFEFAAIVAVIASIQAGREGRRDMWLMALAGLLSVLAVLTKQSAVIVPAAMVTYFVLMRDIRRLVPLVTVGILSAFLLAIFGTSWFGSGLWDNTINGVNNGIVVVGALHAYSTFLVHDGGAILIALVFAVLFTSMTEKTPDYVFFLLVVFVAFLAWAALTALKEGSGAHYFFEAAFTALLLVAFAVFGETPAERRLDRHWATVVLVFLAVYAGGLTVEHGLDFHNPPHHYKGLKPEVNYLRSELKAHPDTYLYASNSALAVYFPRRAVISDLYVSRMVQGTHTVDYHPLLKDVEAGRIGYFVMYDWESPAQTFAWLGVKGVSNDRFSVLKRIGHTVIWTPRRER